MNHIKHFDQEKKNDLSRRLFSLSRRETIFNGFDALRKMIGPIQLNAYLLN